MSRGWEFPRWRVYEYVDRDDNTVLGHAAYFGRDYTKADMAVVEEMHIEGWLDLASELLYRLIHRIESWVSETGLRPLSLLAYGCEKASGWVHVRRGCSHGVERLPRGDG